MEELKTGSWIINAVIQEDGTKKIFRMLSDLPDWLDKSDFSTCVVIEWRYEGALPNKDLMSAMKVFEDAMEPLDDFQSNSGLVHIITGNGMREWCYYAKDYTVFINQLNEVLADKPQFPIGIDFQENTDWNYWEALLRYANEES